MFYSFIQAFFDSLNSIFSQLNGLFMPIKMKICWDVQSVFTSMVDAFPSCKDVHNAMEYE